MKTSWHKVPFRTSALKPLFASLTVILNSSDLPGYRPSPTNKGDRDLARRYFPARFELHEHGKRTTPKRNHHETECHHAANKNCQQPNIGEATSQRASFLGTPGAAAAGGRSDPLRFPSEFGEQAHAPVYATAERK